MADGAAALAKLISNLDALATNGADEVAAELEPAVQRVIESEYDQGRDPNGRPWANKVDGTPSHLQKSGAMRAGSQAVRGVKGVSVRIPMPGGFHQGGTVKMVSRKLVPDGPELPGDWAKAAEEAARAVLIKGLK